MKTVTYVVFDFFVMETVRTNVFNKKIENLRDSYNVRTTPLKSMAGKLGVFSKKKTLPGGLVILTKI